MLWLKCIFLYFLSDLKIFHIAGQMTIFFTRVFTRRYTLFQKSTYASQKILQNQYFHKPSVKNQNKSCFLPLYFDLGLTSFLDICVRKKLWRTVLSNMRDIKWRKGGWGRIDLFLFNSPRLALSWMCLKRFIFPNCVLESVLFEWLCLYEMSLDED